ncbi:glycosyltransferase family 4 protein [Candidatus Omnitrophota bacterium]
MSALNILLISDVSPKEVMFGAGRALNGYSRGLAKKGNTVFVLTGRDKGAPPEESMEGVKIYTYEIDRRNFLTYFISSFLNAKKVFNRIVKETKIDLINFHQPLSGLGVCTSPKSRIIPKIYTFHSSWPDEYRTRILKKPGKMSLFRSLWIKLNVFSRRVIERYVLSKCLEIIVLSDFSKKQILERYDIPPGKIKIIPGAVDVEKFKPSCSREEARTIINLPRDKFILFTVRNLVPRMGLENLIDSMPFVLEQVKDAHLIIGGVGALEAELKDMVKFLKLEGAVSFAGLIPEDKLPLYYQAADLFILPTKQLEGFGMVTVEALSSGLPVLGTPVGGTVEILSKLNDDFLFRGTDPDSMARLIIKYSEMRDQLDVWRERCRKYAADNYSWDKIICQYEEAVNNVVES